MTFDGCEKLERGCEGNVCGEYFKSRSECHVTSYAVLRWNWMFDIPA